jgi:hypothetical protein
MYMFTGTWGQRRVLDIYVDNRDRDRGSYRCISALWVGDGHPSRVYHMTT